ncbi:bacillithiol system redox-active protein YtxJ [Paenibacillus sacheonensis]|uniref:Bacillithiol system redox-active protein YtxJ n=1 Tax=Paenibacillus sacheonensis TaxID=742054 RepID=A0A7X5BWZ1_9BACL|nr:bacillithiol system redox-active protein YtxJ [Paenibacillus sacheonensis]MBM7563403.1 bacillithiol system protein YtxJ [Paenibacillus sacheonensis]NBC68042.1 bacillithiol system redox-active protein YtxJ [Paenibacillus sacheonensis]
MSQPFKEIQSIEEWNAALEGSASRPLVVFKHSTTCPVSANAYNEFTNYLNGEEAPGDTDYVLVKVIESRPVSNQIAEDISVKHESPQIILVKDKAKYWTASHWSITEAHMKAVMN